MSTATKTRRPVVVDSPSEDPERAEFERLLAEADAGRIAVGRTVEPQIGERVHRLGMYRMHDLVLELFADLYVPRPAAEVEQPPPAAEGEGIPLAGGA